ncbi:unnamed protein product, partial [Rotaria sp. Silwood2]
SLQLSRNPLNIIGELKIDRENHIRKTLDFKLASSKIPPISFYFSSNGSLNTTLHVSKTLYIDEDILLSTLLIVQYNPQLISQVNIFTS